MLKEVICTLENGIVQSHITEQEDFITKKRNGWDMIAFQEVGKKRNTWIPLGANVTKIVVLHAETGRVMYNLYDSNK